MGFSSSPHFTHLPYPFSSQEISMPPLFYGKKSSALRREHRRGAVYTCGGALVCDGGKCAVVKSTSTTTLEGLAMALQSPQRRSGRVGEDPLLYCALSFHRHPLWPSRKCAKQTKGTVPFASV
jgi:hypothetical protein